ncbi:MAG: hypothetical protein QXT45_07995 [Candidatus Bilamarchaeaceae archaeon]
MVLKEVETKPVHLVIPKIELTAETATKNANVNLDKIKEKTRIEQLNLTAIQFQKSKNETIAALGKVAERFINKKNFDDATLALGIAELLTQASELKDKYAKEWKVNFEEYVKNFIERTKAGLTEEDRKEAYLTMSVVVNNIVNASRAEKLDFFAERAQSPKWKESTKALVLTAIEGAKKFYSEGKMEEGDKVLAYLTFYTETILKKGIRGNEGRGAAENAIKASLVEDFEKAEKLFQKGLKDYNVTIIIKQLWDRYASLESSYNITSDVYGKSAEAEKMLKETKEALDNRKVNIAFKRLNELGKKIEEHAANGLLRNMDEIQKDLKATPEVMEGYKKLLTPFLSEFPEEAKGIIAKLEKVSADATKLLNESENIKKDYKLGKENEKKTAKFYSDIEVFSKDKKHTIATASTGVLLMSNVRSNKELINALKMSNVEPVRKGTVIESIEKAIANMRKGLGFIIKEGPESKKAKSEYGNGIYNMMGALALLDLERLPYTEAEKKFAFFQQASMKVYDGCTKAKATADVWKLNSTLYNMVGTVLTTDDKLFETKEAGLQQDVIRNTKQLAAHYIAKIDGKKEGTFSPATVAAYENAIAKDSATLAKKIQNAERINSALKLAASFIHPSIFIATAVEGAVKEYELRDKISFSTGLMLTASVLAFRHASILKNLGTALKEPTLGMKIAKETLVTLESGIGGTLVAKGVYDGWMMIKNGAYEDAALTFSMFALPLLYATVRKPISTYMGKNIPSYRALTGEFATTLVSEQGKKFGLADVVTLAKKGLEFSRKYAEKELVKTAPALKMKISGTSVPLVVPGPLMFFVSAKKAPKPVEKPVIIDLIKKITPGDKERYANSMKKYGISEKEGVVAGNFYDTITHSENATKIEESLKAIRTKERGIVYKTEDEMFQTLSNQIKGSEKILKEIFSKEYVLGEENSAEIRILALDKGKTWMLNNIGKEFGNLGLFIYFKAVKNLESKFGVNVVRTSAEGDELVIIFVGEKVLKAEEYATALRNEVKAIATEMGFREGEMLTEAITDFSAIKIEALAQINKERKISFRTKAGESFENLDSMMSMEEAKQTLKAMEKTEDVSLLLQFLELPKAKIPKVEIPKVSELPKETKLDAVVSIRIDFKQPTKDALWRMTNYTGKGVSSVDNGIVGPSILNQLGHPVTDVFSKIYQEAIIKEVKQYNLPVSVYDHGPLSVAFKFTKPLTEAEMKALDNAIMKANELLLASPVLKENGIALKGVKAFRGDTKDSTLYMIAKSVIGYDIPQSSYEMIKNLVTLLHTDPAKIIKILADKGFSAETLNVLGNIKEKNIKWVRNPEDLFHYLKNNNIPKKETITILEQLGVPVAEGAP